MLRLGGEGDHPVESRGHPRRDRVSDVDPVVAHLAHVEAVDLSLGDLDQAPVGPRSPAPLDVQAEAPGERAAIGAGERLLAAPLSRACDHRRATRQARGDRASTDRPRVRAALAGLTSDP